MSFYRSFLNVIFCIFFICFVLIGMVKGQTRKRPSLFDEDDENSWCGEFKKLAQEQYQQEKCRKGDCDVGCNPTGNCQPGQCKKDDPHCCKEVCLILSFKDNGTQIIEAKEEMCDSFDEDCKKTSVMTKRHYDEIWKRAEN